MDLKFVGFPFTWHKNYPDFTVRERLDRSLATNEWFLMFPGTKVHYLNVTTSDHKALWIFMEGMDCNFQKPFRFEQMWMKDKGFSETIKVVWSAGNSEPWDSSVLTKIDKCGQELSEWSKKCFGKVRKQLEVKCKQLQTIEQAALRTGDSSRMKFLENEVNLLIDKEAIMWRQWSKTLWLSDGDKNTRLFHSKASQRRRKNYITKLYDVDGRWCFRQDQICDTIVNFYKTLFTSKEPSNFEEVIDTIPHVVKNEMNVNLEADFTIEEVEIALKQMAPLKALGMDGMPQLFY